MSPGEVHWRHRVGRDGLVHVDWSTDGGINWGRVAVKLKTRGPFAISELRIANPTASSLRELRLGALEQYLRQQFAPKRDVAVAGATKRDSVVAGVRATATASGRTGRPERYPDSFYAQVADDYRAALARGLPPRKVLAEAHGVSRAAVARWVTIARARGYLAPTTPGKAGA